METADKIAQSYLGCILANPFVELNGFAKMHP